MTNRIRSFRFGSILLVLMVVASCSRPVSSDIKSTEDLIEVLKQKPGSDVESYTFVQETIRYDTLGNPRDTSTWYEAVAYPDRFRIDIRQWDSGNTAIFRYDSCYRFRDHLLDTTYHSPQAFLFLESGFSGYNTLEEVLGRFEELGYDPDEFYDLEAQGVYVIGGNPHDLSSQQFWLDKEHFYVIRNIMLLADGRRLDVRYDDFVQLGSFWIETKVSVYVEGRLVQLETYQDIDIKPQLPDQFFDPENPFQGHWHHP